MRFDQFDNTNMQGMRPNVPRESLSATAYAYDYQGRYELHRFYDSCIENSKHVDPVRIAEKCTIPVGLVLSFGLFITGTIMGWQEGDAIIKIGFLCFFGMMVLKFILMKKVQEMKKTNGNINFSMLNAYLSEYRKNGFTAGRKYSYCLMGDTAEQYELEKRTKASGIWIPVLVIGFMLILGITFLATKGNPEKADIAFEFVIGITFVSVGLVIGIGTLFNPLIKRMQYGRKVTAVCVDVQNFCEGAGESSSSRPIYMAVVDGRDYIYFHEIKSNIQGSSVGDVFPIYVSRKNPYIFANSQSFGNVMFGMIFTICFIPIGVVMLGLGIMSMHM